MWYNLCMIKQTLQESKAVRICTLEDGKEVGHAYLYLVKNDLNERPYGLLEDLFVEEHARGNGFAKELVEEILEAAKRENCYKVIATSRFSREHVHKMYEKAGFVEHGKEYRLNL